MPKGFLPSEDMGFLVASTEAEQGVSFQGMVQAQHSLDPLLEKEPHVAMYNSVVGIVGSSQSMNNGILLIHLKPHKERPGIESVAERLRRELNGSPSLRVFLRVPPAINIGGRSSKALYQYTLSGPDINALYDSAQKVEEALRKLPQIQDVNSDLQLKNPELRVTIDRNRAAALGVSRNRSSWPCNRPTARAKFPLSTRPPMIIRFLWNCRSVFSRTARPSRASMCAPGTAIWFPWTLWPRSRPAWDPLP